MSIVDRIASRYLEANSPLTPREERDLAKANVFVMDWELDGGTFPPRIQKLVDLTRELTSKEARELLKWFYSTAPGNY